MNDSVDLSPAERDASAYLLGTAAEMSYRDDSPPQPTGALPVAQPGRPPQPEWAVGTATVMLAGGAASVPLGLSASLVMYVAGQTDPAALAVAGAAPVALVLACAVLAKAVGRATRDVVSAAPPVTVNNYAGPVTANSATSTSRTVFGRAASTSKTGR
ncbi:hypothetical protein [Streptomyces sp. NPDC090093]|uniref:hypothetical protein n=1 Tax=Streptomyces sp. NPDC090093 TaxID=3365945 RepID=UPI003825D001